MTGSAHPKKITSEGLPRGAYLLRYEEAADDINPPTIRVSCVPGVNQIHPDFQPILSAPGMMAVVVAFADGLIHYEIEAGPGGHSLDATLSLEEINPRSFRSAWTAPDRLDSIERNLQSDVSVNRGGFAIIGHTALLGDVLVRANEWLGGPTHPFRIEGLLVRWPNPPPGLFLRYAGLSEGGVGSWSGMTGVGKFVGTRGQARPFVALRFELQGGDAIGYTLVADYLFEGRSAKRVEGQAIELADSYKRAPLLGLKLSIAKL